MSSLLTLSIYFDRSSLYKTSTAKSALYRLDMHWSSRTILSSCVRQNYFIMKICLKFSICVWNLITWMPSMLKESFWIFYFGGTYISAVQISRLKGDTWCRPYKESPAEKSDTYYSGQKNLSLIAVVCACLALNESHIVAQIALRLPLNDNMYVSLIKSVLSNEICIFSNLHFTRDSARCWVVK